MNKVYAIIGPPASGKTTLVKALNNYRIPAIISHTTRLPKKEEINGVDYYFVDKEIFLKLPMIEKVNYSGHFYGLSKDEVLSKVKESSISVVEVDLRGLEQLKKLLGERLTAIFLFADKETILNRYVLQGDNDQEINRRIEYAEAAGEFVNWQTADYVVKNTGQLDVTVRQVLAIMDVSWVKSEV